MLNDFTIQNFRGIEELTLPRLARVNLLVGKNGVGKSSVLEAVELWASDFRLSVLQGQLRSREETQPEGSAWMEDLRRAVSERIFGNPNLPLVLGPQTDRRTAEAENIDSRKSHTGTEVPVVIPAGGLPREQVRNIWGHLSRRGEEQQTANALRGLFPEIEDVSLIAPDGVETPYVRRKGEKKRVPIGSLGDGARRVFGLGLGLAAATEGLLLVDEIENGLHYSTQTDVWRFIFKAARELDVQVIATTHSRDTVYCLSEAAREISTEEPEASRPDHLVYRLQRRRGKLFAVEFDDRSLEFAVEQELEVR